MTTGRIFDIKRFALHDGPGIRTTVFLQGCPLTCPWCHNPESRPTEAVPAFRAADCLACAACTEICPGEVKPAPDAPWPVTCERCGRCVSVCPTGARELAGRDVTVDTLLAEIERDRLHFEESGGGITFSGGEPLAQPEFLQELLEGCRVRELHTAVDTAGHAPFEIVRAAAPATDLWLYDLKHPDPERHRALMGVDNTLILKNLEWLVGTGQTVWLRVPVIGGVNDDAPTMRRIGALARELGLDRLHLLPFHPAAQAKRDRFLLAEGEPAEPGGASPPPRDNQNGRVVSPPPSRDQLAGLAAALRGYGLDVIIGG